MKIGKFHRESEECSICGCYYSNLDDDTRKEFEDAAPGEDCTLGEQTWKGVACPFFQHTEEGG